MPRIIIEVGYDEYLRLTGASISEQARDQAAIENRGYPEYSLEAAKRGQPANAKLLLLHIELRGRYGDDAPTGRSAKDLRKLNSARSYITRTVKKWEPYERDLALRCLKKGLKRGIWMSTIVKVLEQLNAGLKI